MSDDFQYVKLPDGSYGKFSSNAGDDVIRAAVQKDFPDAFKDNRSLLDKAKDKFSAVQASFDKNTQTSSSEPLLETGLKSVVGAVGTPFVHPVDTATSLAKTAMNPISAGHAAGNAVYEDYKNGGLPYAATKLAGQVAGSMALGEAAGPAIGGAVRVAGRAASGATEALGDAASNAKQWAYPTSRSVAADVSGARNLSKALVVDPAGVNNFVKAATDEAGTVLDYAERNNIPINSKVDFANAAKQTADTVQAHFDDAILEPNAKKVVSVPASYQGPKIGEGNNASLGAINDRINAINSELKSNFRKSLQSQTSAANTSDAELVSEKQALTNTLHKQLAQATGLSPEEIADLRVKAGKLRTIADESQASANRDLTAAGKQAMGTTTSAVGTKAGLIDRGLQAAQGGPEIIGNRQVNSALKMIQPRNLILPQPNGGIQ